jgi:hypothetical protein
VTLIEDRPRVDPLNLLSTLEAMSTPSLGEFMYPFLRACLDGRADLTSRHVCDLCGWVLWHREHMV